MNETNNIHYTAFKKDVQKVFIYLFIIFLIALSFGTLKAQITIKGKVTDVSSSEPIPFATVYVKGTANGVTTDFNGEYKIETGKQFDSLTVQYLGYKSKTKRINKSLNVVQLDFQLSPSSNQLQEVTILMGENPAWPILRKVISHKQKNSNNNLPALEYQTYTRSEICLDNISDKLKKNLVIGNIAKIIDNAQKVAGEDGKPVIPVFVSEVISKNYFRNNPKKSKESILNSKISGIALADNSIINQFVGSGLQNVNFYNNFSNILTKDFVSPICDEWKINYKYFLVDSTFINDRFCYEIKFYPKNKFDLAFAGKMWIDKLDYSLIRMDAQINKEANINYVEKIKVQHEFKKIDSTWFISNSRIVVDLAELSDLSSGVLIKTNSNYHHYSFVNPQPLSFFDTPIEINTTDSLALQNFDSIRPVALTQDEKKMYSIIDSIKNIPKVRSWLETLDLIISGYKSFGKIEFGPYPYLYAYNLFEHHRFRIGFRTTQEFNKNWIIRGYLAASTGGPIHFKPELEVSRIMSRKRYCELGAKYHFDAEQIGITSDFLALNSGLATSIFAAASRFGKFIYPYYLQEFSLYCNTELIAGLTQNFTIQNRFYKPVFSFECKVDPENAADSRTKNCFQVSELVYDFRYSPGEVAMRSKRNKRFKVRVNRNNFIYNLRYTYGSKLLGDYEYHKISAGISRSFMFGFLGRSTITLSGGYTPSRIPFPLLFIHQGNQSYLYLNNAFNQMNYLEFVSDKYASLTWQHNFEGLFFNRVPLIQKWGWRTHASGKVLFGSLSDENRNMQVDKTQAGLPITPINGLNINTPYIEVGYGVSNILKCLRVDFIHRLTYLDHKDVSPFSVKFSIEIKL